LGTWSWGRTEKRSDCRSASSSCELRYMNVPRVNKLRKEKNKKENTLIRSEIEGKEKRKVPISERRWASWTWKAYSRSSLVILGVGGAFLFAGFFFFAPSSPLSSDLTSFFSSLMLKTPFSFVTRAPGVDSFFSPASTKQL